jgi:hypothetical protein
MHSITAVNNLNVLQKNKIYTNLFIFFDMPNKLEILRF